MSNYKKHVLNHSEFYVVTFTKEINKPYLIFIHGGPGFNCGTVEYLIEHDNLFAQLNYNIVLYDQRNCGRSLNFSDIVTHTQNVDDLQNLYDYLAQTLEIKGFMGHSYGAKLLFDFYKKCESQLPGIFISTADSILTPRLNNLILDLAYLKKSNPAYYQEISPLMNNLDLKKAWELTEKLAPLFQANPDRHFLYWANLDCYEKTQKIQKEIQLPPNTQTFMSVRKDLYSNESNFSVQIETLNSPYLWINGFQDYIMNGMHSIISSKSKINPFYQSAHYPHIEEDIHFCETVNGFIKNI